MKNLRKIIAIVALVAAIMAVFAGCGTKTQEGAKTITVVVTNKEGKDKTFTYTTDEKYLGPVLREEGLVTGHYDGDSFFIDAVDGLTADYSVDESWWQVLAEGEAALVGVDEIAIKDGGSYQLVYTIGFG